jgi:hypothetical protein
MSVMVARPPIRNASDDKRGVVMRAWVEAEPMLRSAGQEDCRNEASGNAMESGEFHELPV